jgi:hypothetical protein
MDNFTDTERNVELLQEAATLAEAGQLRAARTLVKQALHHNSSDIAAWWALTQLAANDAERNQALKELLLRDPQDPHALHLRDQIRAGSMPSLDILTYQKSTYRKNPKYRMDESYLGRKDYLLPAIGTFIGYLLFWFAGLGLNLYFLQEARKLEQNTGIKQQHVGCLHALLGVYLVLPATAVSVLLVMILLSGN